MYVIIDLYGDTHGIATTDTKASGENDVVLQTVIIDCFVHQFDDAIRAFDMTGASDTYLNNHLMTIPFCRV